MRGNHTRQPENSQKIKQIAADHISDRHVQMTTTNGNDRSDYFRQRSTYGDNGQSNDELKSLFHRDHSILEVLLQVGQVSMTNDLSHIT